MRKSKIHRKTKETDILLELNLDGKCRGDINTSVPFMDHMLRVLTMQAGIALKVVSKGDREVDDHHIVEDIGLVFGEALKIALGDKKGIERYGNFLMPMDEALSYIVIDMSGRPYLKYEVKLNANYRYLKSEFNYELMEDFFRALVTKSGMTLHITKKSGSNNHHIAESMFKGFGKALGMAVKINPKRKGVPSTKGIL